MPCTLTWTPRYIERNFMEPICPNKTLLVKKKKEIVVQNIDRVDEDVPFCHLFTGTCLLRALRQNMNEERLVSTGGGDLGVSTME